MTSPPLLFSTALELTFDIVYTSTGIRSVAGAGAVTLAQLQPRLRLQLQF